MQIISILFFKYLPFIVDGVIVLRWSNGNETLEEINLFFSYISSFNPFTQLRSLKLFSLHSYQTLLKLLDQCHQFKNLTDLTFYRYCYEKDQTKVQSVLITFGVYENLLILILALLFMNEIIFLYQQLSLHHLNASLYIPLDFKSIR